MSEFKRMLHGGRGRVTSRYQAKVRLSLWEGVYVNIGANIGNHSIFSTAFATQLKSTVSISMNRFLRF